MKRHAFRAERKRLFFRCGAALVFALAGVAGSTGVSLASDSVDYSSVPTGNVKIVDRFEKAQPSGIARLPDGRIILSFPVSAQWHAGPVLAEWNKGSLKPFPGALAQHDIISPLGMTVDAQGQLWVIDEGVKAGHKIKAQPALLHIDPVAGKIVRSYPFTKPVVWPDSHVNDVRVDLTHGKAGTAFVSDTSETSHPALIVVDLASGKMRRILRGSISVRPVPGLVMQVDHELKRYDPKHPVMGQGGVDGLTLSADSSRLYWSPLSSRRLYSAPTAELADFHLSEEVLKSAVTDEGEVGIMDGMATAPDGSFYLTDIERHAVIRRSPDGELNIVAQDPRLIAPDSLALDGNSLLLTVGQWSRLPAFNEGDDRQERPYILVRITPLEPAFAEKK